MDSRLILVNLLVKLGVAAAVSSALVRSREVQDRLFKEDRNLNDKLVLVLAVGTPFALGVMVRTLVHNFLAADMGLECAILLGVVGGRVSGVLGGSLVAIPALVAGEWLTLPLNLLAGFMAGELRDICTSREDIWTFTPFVDLSVYRWLRRMLTRPALEWQTTFFAVILGLEYVRMLLAREFPGRLFALYYPGWQMHLAILAAAVASIAIPLKVWNNTRIERKLEEQERLLLQARMESLQSQINPHFLFNTLNSIASLVRFDQEAARELIVKLASILRRLLRKNDAFVLLRDEVEFVDDYLDIEVARFGRDKLRVHKELEPASLEVVVPSMLLQPIVENSVKHGLAPKIDGGNITLRSRIAEGKLFLDVEDDGVGMSGQPAGSGIGMPNVAERLKVLYGDTAKMRIESSAGAGTRVELELPILQPPEGVGEPDSVASTLYEARSSTPR